MSHNTPATEVLVLVGSVRAHSVNRQLAETATEVAPEGVAVHIHDGLADVPFYNEDLDVEGALPLSVQALRDAAADADAALLVSPEYNGTIPAVLKNAIDWLSRPYGAGALTGKPVAVIGTSLGQHGGMWAHDDARKSVGIAGGKVLDDAALSIGGSGARFGDRHPREDAGVVVEITQILQKLNDAAPVKVPA